MTKQEIRDAVAKWKSLLWLGGWNIDVRWVKRIENPDCICQVFYSSEYLDATLEFPEYDIERIEEKHVVHEMIHIAIAALAQVAEEKIAHSPEERAFVRHQKELVTSHLTRVFCEMANVPWIKPQEESPNGDGPKETSQEDSNPGKGVQGRNKRSPNKRNSRPKTGRK